MSESSSDEDFVHLSPVEMVPTVQTAELTFLPEKSREKYLKAYEVFDAWRHSIGATKISEAVMLKYFTELSKSRQSSTLWSIYSMLKPTVRTKDDIHIENYSKLLTFLKKAACGHKPKKSKIFTASEIEKFLTVAHDSEYLAMKVVLIIGISGACRTHELTFLTTNNVEKHSEKLLLVNLTNTRSNKDRSFVIRDEYVKIVEKYQALRPVKLGIDRFFLQYRRGKCTAQPMGTNKIGAFPREIAAFLELKDPEKYTGHCFKRTSASLLVESGADLTTLKRNGSRQPKNVTEVYIVENKPETCRDITREEKKKRETLNEGKEAEEIPIIKEETKLYHEVIPSNSGDRLSFQNDSLANDYLNGNDLDFDANTSDEPNLDASDQAENSRQSLIHQQGGTQISNQNMPSSSSTVISTPARRQPVEIKAEHLEISRNADPNLQQRKSEDYHFLMSLLPNIEQLTPVQKMRLRIKINQAVLEEMELCTYGHQ